MQKGKHQVGQTQGYVPRNNYVYPGNPDNSRPYIREVSAFHASGTPGGGPGMRGMHHAPPTQPPTPPTSQDIKQPPTHLQPQAHQMPPQSAGGQIMQYSLPGTGRGSTQQTPFYHPSRAPLGSQRMAHARPSMVMSNSAQSFMSQPVVQPLYQGQILSGQGPVYVAPQINQHFQIQQPRHQSNSFYSAPVLVQQHPLYHYQAMYYPQSVQAMSRAGGPAPNSQGAAPAQPQPPMTLISNHGGAMMSNPGVSQQVKITRPKRLLEIINPNNGRNIFEDLNDTDNTSSRSGESSARQTPQPNTGQKTDQGVVADFATLVAIAAKGGSPNPPAVQKSSSRTSNSRTSNSSESESQASPDPQGTSTPSVSPSKLDTSVESISSKNQIENNIKYDGNQPSTMMRGSWTSVMPGGNLPVEILPMPIHPGMMIPDDMMRSGSLPNQPTRDYQAVQQQTQWMSDGNAVSLPIMINEESAAPAIQMESPARPERVTPVVSALAHAPTVDIAPRPQREQFPVLGKGHQQQSPVKRKQRSEQSQEQQSEVKAKDQPSKVVAQSKHKSATPTADAAKKQQPTPPSQDSDENVQSVQTKSSEPKTTITIKKNDSDSCSGTKAKSDDSLKGKENNADTRNLPEDPIQDGNRSKSENVKRDVAATPKDDGSPTPTPTPPPPPEDTSGKKVVEAASETSGAVSEPETVEVSAAKDSVPSKPNGEATVEEEAKSNNQKSKPGSKRPAQSKMRLEAKHTRNAAEPNPPEAIEATPSAPSAAEKGSASAAVVTNDVMKNTEEETVTAEEEKEKEKEDLIVAKKNENNKQATSAKTNDAAHAPAVANKVVLKHHYESDQWSPDNPDGKKKYDRQFIMGLQNQPQSLRKPTNFPNLELLSDNKQRPFDRNVINSMNRSHVDNIYPSFANKNLSQRGQAIPKRGSQQGKPKAAKPTLVQVSLQQDVKLHETENAWRPARAAEPANRTEEEAETAALYKRVRGILNKLTPEKFDTLVAQVQELPIDSQERLTGVIGLVFEKAIDEPSFSVAYAQMCRTLQKIEVPSDRQTGKTGPESFKKLLISKCQNEFEKNSAAELKRDERLKEIEREKDLEKKKMLQLSFEEEERKIRMRSVGNIRFIGELYKLQMLTCRIMHECINHLLNQGDEESLECLCKLLTTVGQGLENSANKTDEKVSELNQYFKRLNDIVKNKGSGKVSSRVRFMIQDLIDLRGNKWVPRRNESQPKTIDQIQKEAERENMQMNMALNAAYQERNKRQDIRNSTDGRKRGAPDSSGWTTVTNSQLNKSRLVVESSKLKLDQSDVEVASTLSLGNRKQFVWGQSASSGKADDSRPMSQLGPNRFALLLGPTTGNSSLKGSSMEKDRMNSYKSLEDDLRSSKNQPEPASRSSSRGSASFRRENNRFISPTNNKTKVPPPPASDTSDKLSQDDLDEIDKKTNSLLNEYLANLDMNEATKDLNELFTPSSLKYFVKSVCSQGMDKKGSEPKRAIGLLLNHFITTNSISKELFLAEVSKLLETTDDLAIDMPCWWEYLAEILIEMCAKEVLTFRDVVSAMNPIQGLPDSAKLLAALVKMLVEMKGMTWLKDRWADSQVSLTDVINEADVNNFVKQNNLEFMLGKNIKMELSRLIAARACFDEIHNWVCENVGKEKSTEPLFVRTLMTVLLEAAVTKGQSSSYKLDTELFSDYEQLILRYTNHDENLELPCLFAVQAFVHKLEYPQAILHNIFNYLWDGSLITIESFKSWRKSRDPQEQEGHAVCVTSLTSFFTHLDETETDEDES